LPRSFALFWRHAFPTFSHPTAETGTTMAAKTMAAKKYPAQHKDSEPLPERYLPPAEQRRQQPVPQAHYYFAADEDKERYPQNRQGSYPNQFPSSSIHIQSLIFRKL
jgi:hypothetical protein